MRAMNDKTFKLKPLTILIDADKFFLDECQRCGSYPYIQSNPYNRESLRERLDKAPRVDYEPVEHAYWIDLSEEYTDCDGNVEIVKRFKCSSCGNKETTKSDYCRRCGSKMDGGIENDKQTSL